MKNKKKNNTLGLYGGYEQLLFGGMGDGLSLMHQMLHYSEENRIKKLKEEFDITRIDGLEGSVKLNIPHQFKKIEIKGDYIHCDFYGEFHDVSKGSTAVYTIDGKYLFTGDFIEDKGEGMFLVSEGGKNRSDTMYALYNQEIKLSDYVFKNIMGKYNKQGFCIVGTKGWNKDVVIDKEGIVKYESDSYDHPYIYGVVVSGKSDYINLLTGKRICKKGYKSTLSTNEFMFVQVETNSVYQINTLTGEFSIHGEPEKYEEPKPVVEKVKEISKATEAKPKEQTRNEKCNCGSGKKYKQCCQNKK